VRVVELKEGRKQMLWTWYDQDGNEVDLETWQSPGFYNNLQLCDENKEEIIGCGEYCIINNLYSGSPHRRKAVTNARLLAAAPRLLDKLTTLTKMAKDGDLTTVELDEATALIEELSS
jgi:hypothetical protein